MTSNIALQPSQERGWRSGFTNMLRKENSIWWGTRRWWVQSLVWLLIANGLFAFLLWVVPLLDPTGAPSPSELLEVFMMLFGFSAAFGVMILAQSAIVGEKRSGTAAWIMSNPISRIAFIMAKLVGNGIAILSIIVVLQGLVGYLQFSLRGDEFLPALPFVGAMALQTLHLLFYLTLSLMLGTLFKSRGPVIGLSITVLMVQEILGDLVGVVWPWLPQLLPAKLPDMASLLARGQALPSTAPILSTTVLSVLFILVAIWRFGREEF